MARSAALMFVLVALAASPTAARTLAEVQARGEISMCANPDALLWGSDWPYVRMDDKSPDAGALLDLFHDWVPDAAVRQRILVDNPAALYGFNDTKDQA